MKRIAYELYDHYLTIKENADKLGCSVVALKKPSTENSKEISLILLGV